MLFLTIVIFIIILGLLIFVHEFGHFLSAKLCGVKVEEFGFGFPPKIFKFKRGETVYSLNLIPLGGFVKLLGEEEKIENPRSFNNQSIPKRIFIVTAGVLMNLIFAVVVLTIGFTIGMAPLVSNSRDIGGRQQTDIIIADTVKDSPAEKSGFSTGDIITGYNSIEDFQTFTKSHKNEEVTFQVKRDSKVSSVSVKLADSAEAPLGVALVQATQVKLPFFQAVRQAIVETGKTIGAVFKFLYDFFHNLLTGKEHVSEQVAGPVGIFSVTKQAVKLGISYVLQFMALLSINLAIMNILPFPALDGGKVVFLALEGVRGKRVIKMEIENLIHWIGFAILIALIVLITYNDIVRLVRG